MVPSHLRLHVSVRTGAGTVCSEAQARGLEVNCCCWREVNCEQESEQQQEAKGQRPCLEVLSDGVSFDYGEFAYGELRKIEI